MYLNLVQLCDAGLEEEGWGFSSLIQELFMYFSYWLVLDIIQSQSENLQF